MVSRAFNEIKSHVTEHKADLTDLGFIERYELLHSQDGGGLERLIVVRDLDAKDPEVITELLYKQAVNDCDSRAVGTPQRYIIHGYRHADEPDFKYAFSLNTKMNVANSGDTEPATSTGLLGQLMRQSEKQHQHIMGFSEAISGRLAQELLKEREYRLKLESNAQKVNESLAELQDRAFEREEARAARLATEQRQQALMAMVMNFAPILLGQLASAFKPAALPAQSPTVPPAPPGLGPSPSGDSAPQAASTGQAQDLTVREKAVADFLGSLSTDEVTATIKAVGPDKSIALFEIFKSYSDSAG